MYEKYESRLRKKLGDIPIEILGVFDLNRSGLAERCRIHHESYHEDVSKEIVGNGGKKWVVYRIIDT